MNNRLRWLLVVTAVGCLVGAAVAYAASRQPQTLQRYTVERTGLVRGAPELYAYGRAYAVLPASWKTASANGATRMRFSVPGSCRARVDLWISHVIDDGAETPEQRVGRRRPAEPAYVYGQGSRSHKGAWREQHAAWRVLRLADRKVVRGFYTQPLQSNWPAAPQGKRVWLEVQATARARNTACHTGGMREAVAWPLVTAFGAMSGVGFPDNS